MPDQIFVALPCKFPSSDLKTKMPLVLRFTPSPGFHFARNDSQVRISKIPDVDFTHFAEYQANSDEGSFFQFTCEAVIGATACPLIKQELLFSGGYSWLWQ